MCFAYLCLFLVSRVGFTGQNGSRKLDLTYPTTEFYKTVKQWDMYDESSMGIHVRYLKGSAEHSPFISLFFFSLFFFLQIRRSDH
jgi:poly(A) polymerase Pap1